MFNSSRPDDFHVSNISSNRILQVCENESNCQPKLEYQKYSCKYMLMNYQSLLKIIFPIKPLNNRAEYKAN